MRGRFSFLVFRFSLKGPQHARMGVLGWRQLREVGSAVDIDRGAIDESNQPSAEEEDISPGFKADQILRRREEESIGRFEDVDDSDTLQH